ncbi:MAG: hybrid sensor histidine kinase/response regulator [Gammaproteobacteria bacterium]|nr:hybrid sensor histidine kinase/response regulator [Gammaproteobacteria bacterium]
MTNNNLESEFLRVSHNAPLMPAILNIPVAMVVGMIFVDKVPAANIIAWVSFVSLASVIRAGYLLYFRKLNPPDPIEKKWATMLILTLGLFGMSWGSSAFLLYVPDSYQMQMAIAAIGSVSAIFMTLSVSYLPGFLAFILMSLPPHITRFFLNSTTEHHMTGLVLILLIATSYIVASYRGNAIRETLRLRQELAQQKDRAEQANLAKSRFLAAASHDLRQPLHALSLFAEALKPQVGTEKGEKLVDNIGKSVMALEGLLNALLDISRLDAGAITPKKEVFNLDQMVQQLVDEMNIQALEKSLSLEMSGHGGHVQTDPALLETILRNLVSNAIRYTNSGGVTIKLSAETDNIRINVIDTGIGIPQESIEDVFEEFRQLNNPERDRTRGLGLGLAIVRRLAGLLEHPLSVTSRAGEGSNFGLALPRSNDFSAGTKTLAQQPFADTASENARPICILVLDDEADVRQGMEALLEDWGIRSIMADSIQQAIDRIDACGRTPDGMIVDLRLRGNDNGFQAIEMIRRHAGQAIEAIIVTGDIAPERLKEIKEHDFSVLHKPVNPARIRAFIQHVARTTRINTADNPS